MLKVTRFGLILAGMMAVGSLFFLIFSHQVRGKARVASSGTYFISLIPGDCPDEIVTKYRLVWEFVRFEDKQAFTGLQWEVVFVDGNEPDWFLKAARTGQSVCFRTKYFSPETPGGLYRLYDAELLE